MLFPPGMGDIYWCLTKLEDYKEKNKIDKIDAYILDSGVKNRSLEFLKRFNFIDSVSYSMDIDPRSNFGLSLKHIGNQTTTSGIIPDYISPSGVKYDRLFWFNTMMDRFGKTVDEIAPEYETNWYPEMNHNVNHEHFKTIIENQYKTKYVVGFFVAPNNMYNHWRKHLDYDKIYSMLLRIYNEYGYKSVIIGREWDMVTSNELRNRDGHSILIDYTGKTDTNKMFGLFEGAEAVIGDSAGNVLMAPYFKKKTICFWSSEYFKATEFFVNTVPPDSVNNWYHPIDVKDYNEERIINILSKHEQNSN